MAEEVQLEDLNSCEKQNAGALDDHVSQNTKVNTQGEKQEQQVRIKKPRRVLHFSDGTLEEYSTDEEDNTDSIKEMSVLPKVDPVKLTWGPWMWYWTLYTGSSALAACDYVGESLANFMGITSPKYQYEIEEFKRMQEEEAKEKKEQEEQMAGWTIGDKGEKGGIVSGEFDSQPAAATTTQPSLKESSAEEENHQKAVEISPENVDLELPIEKLNITDAQNNEQIEKLNEPSTDETDIENKTNPNPFMKPDSNNQQTDLSQIDINSTAWKRF